MSQRPRAWRSAVHCQAISTWRWSIAGAFSATMRRELAEQDERISPAAAWKSYAPFPSLTSVCSRPRRQGSSLRSDERAQNARP